jgi:E3 ubiquitin-protein ligase DOA10
VSVPTAHIISPQSLTSDPTHRACAICQGDYALGDTLAHLPCQHAFHEACVSEWLVKYSKKCPVCNARVCEGVAQGVDV